MEQEKRSLGEAISRENLERIFRYVESTSYGTVTLIIQNGKVVSVERTEKIKLV